MLMFQVLFGLAGLLAAALSVHMVRTNLRERHDLDMWVSPVLMMILAAAAFIFIFQVP